MHIRRGGCLGVRGTEGTAERNRQYLRRHGDASTMGLQKGEDKTH